MGQLVWPGQLAAYLQHTVRSDSELIAIEVAEGWLAAVAPPPWPQPPPSDLWAWALELAAIVYSNPQSLVSRSDDQETRGWATDRRREILEAAAASSHGTAGATAAPIGCFPAPAAWPDPALVVAPPQN